MRKRAIILTTGVLFSAVLCAPSAWAGPDPYANKLILTADKIPNFGHPDLVKAGHHIVDSNAPGNLSDAIWSGALDETAVMRVFHPVTVNGNIRVAVIAVYPGGELNFLNQNRTVEAQTIIVHQGGKWIMGTPDRPITANVQVIFRDIPINKTNPQMSFYDPAQYGNGFLGMGEVSVHGKYLARTFARTSREPRAGDSSLALLNSVSDWDANGEVIIPDTRICSTQNGRVTWSPDIYGGEGVSHVIQVQSERRRLASSGGSSLQLTNSLSFDHWGARRADGQTIPTNRFGESLLPHFLYLTRNIVFRSENPAGTPGHVALFHRADVDIRYAAFSGLGRTTTDDLHSTQFDANGDVTRVGTNQVGRYVVHFHHLFGPASPSHPTHQIRFIGNSLMDAKGKWALAIHNSWYADISKNVLYNVPGAGIVNESGGSLSDITDNIVAHIEGARTVVDFRRDGTIATGLFIKGGCFEGKTLNDKMSGFYCYDANEAIGLYSQVDFDGQSTSYPQPAFRGADPTNMAQSVPSSWPHSPFDVSDLEAWNVRNRTIGLWQTQERHGPNMVMKHFNLIRNGKDAFFLDYSAETFDHIAVYQSEPGTPVPSGRGVRCHNANHNDPLTFQSSVFEGLAEMFAYDDRHTQNLLFQDSYFRNAGGIVVHNTIQGNRAPVRLTVRNCKFDAMPGRPNASIETRLNTLFEERGGNYIHSAVYRNIINVFDYQQIPGKNLEVFYVAQAPDYEYTNQVDDSDPRFSIWTCSPDVPVGTRVTNRQCWADHHFALFQRPAPCADQSSYPEIKGITCNAVNDTTPPAVPSDVTARANSDAGVDLGWVAPEDPESGTAHYRIYRDGDYDRYGVAHSHSYKANGLDEGRRYCFEVSGVNFADLESGKSTPAVCATTLTDTTAPTILSVLAAVDPTKVVVLFSEPVELASGEAMANYQIDRAISVSGAKASADGRSVTLSVSKLSSGVPYVLTVSNVRDRARQANTILANTVKTFTFTLTGPGGGGNNGKQDSVTSDGPLGRLDSIARVAEGDCSIGWPEVTGTSVHMDLKIFALPNARISKEINRSQANAMIDVCQEKLASGSYLFKGKVNGQPVKNLVVVVR